MKTIDMLREERMKKLEKLKKLGHNPYPSFSGKKNTIAEVRQQMEKEAEVVGKIYSVRGHGKLVFADIKDETEKIQLMCKVDNIDPKYFDLVELIDVGDYVWAKGTVTKTIKGEISLLVKELRFLSKSLHPLPEKWHGLKDVEERYRQRYVDLLVNPEVKNIFLTRSKVVTLLRTFLDKNGFLEVETPILQPLYGGASAKPFTTHHNAHDINLYLRISNELYLKRLIVGGFEKVYEMGRDFRNEGMSRAHNPEFSMLEFYWAYADYETLMKFTEEMFKYVIEEIKGDLKITFKEKVYDFSSPWKRITYKDLIQQHTGIDIDKVTTETQLKTALKEKGLLDDNSIIGYRNLLDIAYKKHVRPNLEGPLFITDYPVDMKPLAKRIESDSTKSASFQLLVAGEELINAYNELNDPQDQKKRWEEEMEMGKKGADDYQVLDEDYIRALEYGMPPTAGWGLGIDRFVALLTDQHTIKDVIFFPTMKPENG
ncbi:MAG: lysine--tRNA ligase [bacterium]|nr:lysine--tRNA ligase [bacterium]